MLRQVADQTDPIAFLSVGSCTSEGQKLLLGRSHCACTWCSMLRNSQGHWPVQAGCSRIHSLMFLSCPLHHEGGTITCASPAQATRLVSGGRLYAALNRSRTVARFAVICRRDMFSEMSGSMRRHKEKLLDAVAVSCKTDLATVRNQHYGDKHYS